MSEVTWKFDLSDCADPKGAAEALVKRLDGTRAQDDKGREVQLWADASPDVPGKVAMGAFSDGVGQAQVRKVAEEVAYHQYFECRRLDLLGFWETVDPDFKIFIRRIIRRAIAKKISVEWAVSQLLAEMGRGGCIYVVHKTCRGLESSICVAGYAIEGTEYGAGVEAIKRRLRCKVLITRNGKHFCNPKDLERYHYGLVWVTSTGDDRAVARKVEKALMRANFNRNLKQVVKV